MTRMLEALKLIEDRQRPVAKPAELEPEADLLDFLEHAADLHSKLLSEAGPEPASFDSRIIPIVRQPLAKCVLPSTSALADYYVAIARRINAQLASSYCKVVLFVSPDAAGNIGFSITHLAQAFVLQSSGNVLLVDGDLRHGRLSKTVSPAGPGMTEAMLGTAAWSQIIHATTTPRIDFVSCGNSQIPTFERQEFGWHALRPNYQAVLIGLADAQESETHWLAARCDAVYFVISRKHTRRHLASVAVNALRGRGANVLGCIVTDD